MARVRKATEILTYQELVHDAIEWGGSLRRRSNKCVVVELDRPSDLYCSQILTTPNSASSLFLFSLKKNKFFFGCVAGKKNSRSRCPADLENGRTCPGDQTRCHRRSATTWFLSCFCLAAVFFCTCRWCIARIRIANEENNPSGTCWSVTSVVTKKNLRTANGIKRRTMSGLCDQWTLLTNYSISLLSFQLAVCCIRVVVVDGRSHFRYVRQIIIIQLCRATTWHKNEKCLGRYLFAFPVQGEKKGKRKNSDDCVNLIGPDNNR